MADDARGLTSRQRKALILTGILLGSLAVPAWALVFQNPVPQTGTIPYETNSGATIYVEQATNTTSGNPFPDDQTVHINTTKGNATFSSTGNVKANVTPDNLTGTWTKVHGLDVTAASLSIDPEDKRALDVQGDLDRIKFRDAQVDDGTVDFVYAGTSGATTVTVRGLPANTYILARDADSGDTLDISQSDASGVVTLDGMPNSEHRVLLVESDGSAPELSDPVPNGNVSTAPSTFNVTVDDADYPGDNVTLDWYLEGSQFNSTTAGSPGEYSVTAPSLDSGVQDWSVIATDEAGNQVTINATVGLPGELKIRNETAPNNLVTDEVTVKFDNGTDVRTRNTTTGTIDLSGLPTTDFTVIVQSNESYYPRTVYFQSIVGNASVYLLNRSEDAVETRFELDDPTGEYPSNSIVVVRKAINVSGNNEYRVLYSDRFGTEGVTVDLEAERRYQISIRNPDGDVQEIGPYRSDLSETVTVSPGNPQIQLGNYSEGYASNATLNNRTLEFGYDDPENSTQRLTIWIYEKGNQSNQLRPNATYSDLGTVVGAYTLTANESEKTWVVTFLITFKDGREVVAKEEVANRPDLVPSFDREWRLIFAVFMLLVSAGVFSMLNAGVGAVIVALEGGLLWYAGWLDGATTGVGITLGLLVAVIAHIYTGQRV